VIFSFGAFEKVKLYKARHLVEMTVTRQPDFLESGFAALGNLEAVHCDEHLISLHVTVAGTCLGGVRRLYLDALLRPFFAPRAF
jgi:hypothetical protein